MLNHDYFYHQTIRKMVVIFGNMFNEIYIERKNTETGTPDITDPLERILVPLSYGRKEKYIVRQEQNEALEEGNIAITLPRMGFTFDSLEYDAERKLPSITYNRNDVSDLCRRHQYTPIPYNFLFSLDILTHSIEDLAQILEQILPFFKPEFTVTGDMVPSMNIKHDIPIILNSASGEDTYDTQDFLTKRVITWSLQFTMKGYIYGPTKDISIIREAITDFHIVNSDSSRPITDEETLTLPRDVRLTVVPDPIDAAPGDDYACDVSVELFTDGKRRNPVTGNDEEV